MSSTTTFLEAVNEVLAAAGFSEIAASATPWAAAVSERRRAKRIVARCLDELVNQVPDHHWQHLKEISVLPSFSTGEVTAVSGATVTVSGVNLTTGFTDLGYTGKHCLFRMGGDDHWLKVLSASGTTLTLRQAHPVYTAAAPYPTAAQTADDDTTRTLKIWQWRYALPANFRDVQDAYRPFHGVDVEPLDINGLISRALALMYFHESSELQYYAIGSDQAVAGVPSTLAEAADGPLLYLYPALQDPRVYQLAYQRQPFRLNVDSDPYTTVFDLPEDLMRQLIYRAKMIGAVELGRNPEAASLYRGLEQEQRQNAESKETSLQDSPQITGPGAMYGSHFRKRRIGRGTNIVTWD